MDIYPQDLGERRQALAAVQARRRAAPRGDGLAFLPLTVILTGAGLVSLVYLVTHWNWAVWLVLLPFPVIALVFSLLLRRPEAVAKRAPLTPAQVTRLLAASDDALEREYLRLVLAAAQMPAPPEEVAQAEIREAVWALGMALEKLSPGAAPPLSALKLRGKAASLAAEAAREADPVVAASLRRRAETRGHQAQTAALIETMARRTSALRQELSDEMDALQTSLAAFGAKGVWSVGEMADVAAGIGWIALKARTMAAAQAELDDALHVEHLPNPAYNGPGGVEQRLQAYRSEDTE